MLFRIALGNRFDSLPPVLRAFHAAAEGVWCGAADIDPPSGIPAAAVARAFGFPRAGTSVPLVVTLDRREGPHGPSEVWIRDFGGQRMTSTLRYRDGAVTETFGAFTFAIDLRAHATGLGMIVRGWRLGAVPLPRGLAPRSEASEHQDGKGRFRFDVEIGAPLLGRLVRYRGWLIPAGALANRKRLAAGDDTGG